MLVDQQDGDVFALLSKLLKGMLNRGVVSFGIHNQEVLLRIRRRRDVLK